MWPRVTEGNPGIAAPQKKSPKGPPEMIQRGVVQNDPERGLALHDGHLDP